MNSDPRIGTELAGYRIEEMVGRGGMGVVYRAEQLKLGRKVALKLLAPELAENEAFQTRFERESRSAAAIDHPNIIPLYEAGEADGLLFISMRYVVGTDLKELVRREGPLEPDRAISIVAQVASALDAAHARGLVHRDIKPGNVLVASGAGPESSDHCYLTDFGLTKDTSSSRGLTATGQFVGTIDYVAPEQIEGKPLDGRTDTYALACVLCECLTGQPPFRKESEVALMFAHLNEEPPTLTHMRPGLPEGLDQVVATALAKDPTERYASSGEMVRAARAALTGATIPAPTPGPAAPTRLAGQPGEATVASPAGGPTVAAGGPTVASPAAEAATAGLPGASQAPTTAQPLGRRLAGLGGRLTAVAGVLAAAAAIAGFVVANLGGDGESAGGNVAIASDFRLSFPDGWELERSDPDVTGLEFRDPLALYPRGDKTRGLIAGNVEATGPSLLPSRFLERLGSLPDRDDSVRLGDLEAYRYADLKPPGFNRDLTLYVVPTSRSVVTVGCFAEPPAGSFLARCERVAASLELTGPKPFGLGPSEDYAKTLGGALTKLNSTRTAQRRALRAARTPASQARAADRLGDAYGDARGELTGLSLSPAVRGINRAILAGLADARSGYRKMASAARRESAGGFGQGASAVRSAERRLQRAFDELKELGYTLA